MQEPKSGDEWAGILLDAVTADIESKGVKEVLLALANTAPKVFEEAMREYPTALEERVRRLVAAMPDPKILEGYAEVTASASIRVSLEDAVKEIRKALEFEGVREEALKTLKKAEDGGLSSDVNYLEDYIQELELKVAALRAHSVRFRVGLEEGSIPDPSMGITEIKMWLSSEAKAWTDQGGEAVRALNVDKMAIYDILTGDSITCRFCGGIGVILEGDVSVTHTDDCPLDALNKVFLPFASDDEEEG